MCTERSRDSLRLKNMLCIHATYASDLGNYGANLGSCMRVGDRSSVTVSTHGRHGSLHYTAAETSCLSGMLTDEAWGACCGAGGSYFGSVSRMHESVTLCVLGDNAAASPSGYGWAEHFAYGTCCQRQRSLRPAIFSTICCSATRGDLRACLS